MNPLLQLLGFFSRVSSIRRRGNAFFLLLILAFCIPPVAAAETARIEWDPNPPADNVAGYRLYYGTESGNYTVEVDLGNQTFAVLDGLAKSTTYYLVVTAYSAEKLESLPSEEFQFTTLSNSPPLIRLSDLVGEEVISAPGNLVLIADTDDEDGSVTKVEFFDGTKLLLSDSNYPFAIRVNGLDSGSHTLMAVATDDGGESTESSPLNILVVDPREPTLTLGDFEVDGRLEFHVIANPNQSIRLQASEDLKTWETISTTLTDASGNAHISEPVAEGATEPRKFFRVAAD